jgi:septum formation protein
MLSKKIILASNSPRRRELLNMIYSDVTIAPSRDVDETYPDSLPADDVPQYLSVLKSKAYSDLAVGDNIVVTADTVVISDNKILGKPHDRQAAIDMLTELSGKTHHVVTGVTVASSAGLHSFSEKTEVTFAELSEAEIAHYVDTYRPYDKAGAYGIQEWVGGIGIVGIRGCFYNVMGLPLHRLYKALTDSNFLVTLR